MELASRRGSSTPRAVRAPEPRLRRHERRAPHDPRLRRPAQRRLRGLGRAARADRGRPRAAGDRLRRQGGLPRHLPRAAGAGQERRLRVIAAGRVRRCSSCFRPLRLRTPRFPTRSACAGSEPSARCCRDRPAHAACGAGRRPRPGRPDPARPLRVPDPRHVGGTGRRHRSGRDPRARDRAGARGGGRPRRLRGWALDLDARARVPVPRRQLRRADRAEHARPHACVRAVPAIHPEELAAEFVTGLRWWTQAGWKRRTRCSRRAGSPSSSPRSCATGRPGSRSTWASSPPPRRTAPARPPSRMRSSRASRRPQSRGARARRAQPCPSSVKRTSTSVPEACPISHSSTKPLGGSNERTRPSPAHPRGSPRRRGHRPRARTRRS